MTEGGEILLSLESSLSLKLSVGESKNIFKSLYLL